MRKGRERERERGVVRKRGWREQDLFGGRGGD